MTGSLSDQISAKVSQATSKLRKEFQLSVAVLGLGVQGPDNVGSRKRRQIREALAKDGHKAFFPEELCTSETSELLIHEEQKLLGDASVGLVILLCTDNSPGALVEMAGFVDEPGIVEKTAILFPAELFEKQSMVGNTVDHYRIKTLYTARQFEICDLVEECRKLASERIYDESEFNNPSLDLV